MIRLDLAYFYRISITLEALSRLPEDAPLSESWWSLYFAQRALEQLFQESVITGALRATRAPALYLKQQIDASLNKNITSTFENHERGALIGALDSFRVAFTSELAVADAYFVTPKAGYDTIKLISSGESVFPTDLSYKVPGAIADVREAAKCLAFELPTASAFHVFRAVEATLGAYWDTCSNGNPRPKQQNIGVYLTEMEKRGIGEPQTVAALRQLKDLHRNPLIHPGVNITISEAIAILGIAYSVMAAMLKHIPVSKEQAPPDVNEVIFQPETANVSGGEG